MDGLPQFPNWRPSDEARMSSEAQREDGIDQVATPPGPVPTLTIAVPSPPIPVPSLAVPAAPPAAEPDPPAPVRSLPLDGAGTADFVAPLPRSNRTRHRRSLIGAGATIAVVVALICGVALHTTTAVPTTPSRVVLLSAQTALADKTADLQLSMSIHVPNGDITASGNGAVNFSSNAAQLAVQYSGLPQLNGTQLREVIVGGSLYLSMPGISQFASGKSWVSTPLGTDSITPGSSNPGSMLQLLASQGNTVTPLGPSTIEGTAVHGYNVVISTADLSRELSRLTLPASLDQQMQAVFGSAGLRMTVYVGDANDLIREVDFTMNLSVDGSTVSAVETEDITDYGVPVAISAPPADQVLTLQQFEAAAASAESSSGT